MGLLTAVALTRDGIQVDTGTAAAGGGDSFVNTGRELVAITNGDASSKDITFDIQRTLDGEAVTDKVVTVPAGQTFLAGPFPTSIYNDADGEVQITYSATTSVTVKVVRVGELG